MAAKPPDINSKNFKNMAKKKVTVQITAVVVEGDSIALYGKAYYSHNIFIKFKFFKTKATRKILKVTVPKDYEVHYNSLSNNRKKKIANVITNRCDGVLQIYKF